MSITWAADVVPIAPALSALSTTSQNLILAIVERQIDSDAWADFADDGRRYLAAHLGTLALPGLGGAAAGPITSETLGAMSRSYGMITGVGGGLSATRFGLEYFRLMQIVVGIPALVP